MRGERPGYASRTPTCVSMVSGCGPLGFGPRVRARRRGSGVRARRVAASTTCTASGSSCERAAGALTMDESLR
jgi:hypothetical protein